MARAYTLTLAQASALEHLHYNKVVSANDFDRTALEQLARKGLATKHWNGNSVTFSITGAGETIYKSL